VVYHVAVRIGSFNNLGRFRPSITLRAEHYDVVRRGPSYVVAYDSQPAYVGKAPAIRYLEQEIRRSQDAGGQQASIAQARLTVLGLYRLR
jgi:hypothetical protein